MYFICYQAVKTGIIDKNSKTLIKSYKIV